MGTIIALRGIGNSGKSNTIRILHNLILNNGYQVIDSNFNLSSDFHSIFLIRGIRVGITSSGDNYDLVHDNLAILIDNGCEICVCACRTYDRVPPGTNAAVEGFNNFDYQYVEKTYDNNVNTQTQTNTTDAQRLLTEIENLL